MPTSNWRIDSKRLKTAFDSLAEIGSTKDGGIHRPALSPAHLEARVWFQEQAKGLGLTYSSDQAGNQSALLHCGPPGAPHLLLGSHLDSVPHGGRFDGALGVVCALEVLAAVKQSRLSLPCHLEAMGFCDEEGAHMGLMGSRAMAGALSASELEHPASGIPAFEQGLHSIGLKRGDILKAKRGPGTLAGYLELHIEQGRVLEQAGLDIGVVTGFVGIRHYKLTFKGRADHAGTTPMDQRQDPVPAVASYCLAMHQTVMERFAPAVATVGQMEFSPGAFNVVPDSVTVWQEFRADSEDKLDAMQEAILALARQSAQDHGVNLEAAQGEKTQPVPTSPLMVSSIKAAADGLGLSWQEMPSGAGHDAQAMALICPAGLIFVPSQDGASHSCREFSSWPDCQNGARALLGSALHFAESMRDSA
jgi:N-carbamoyl-L-amino-acid hydrolase